MTDWQLRQLEKIIKDYEKHCSVSEIYVYLMAINYTVILIAESIKRIWEKL